MYLLKGSFATVEMIAAYRQRKKFFHGRCWFKEYVSVDDLIFGLLFNYFNRSLSYVVKLHQINSCGKAADIYRCI